jgi:hypothetical protein
MNDKANEAQLRTLARLWFGIGETRKAGESLADILAKMNMTELEAHTAIKHALQKPA